MTCSWAGGGTESPSSADQLTQPLLRLGTQCDLLSHLCHPWSHPLSLHLLIPTGWWLRSASPAALQAPSAISPPLLGRHSRSLGCTPLLSHGSRSRAGLCQGSGTRCFCLFKVKMKQQSTSSGLPAQAALSRLPLT